MRNLVPPIAAALIGLICVAPAQAEKWMWFPIRGGAVAYDVDSRKEDPEKGVVGADTLIFYDQPRTVAEGEFNFVAERLEFECSNNRQRWQRSAVLDRQGRIVLARPDGDWQPMPKELGSAALFSRVLCLSQDPPGGRQAKDLTSAIAAMRTGSAGATVLADLAFPAPKVVAPAPRVAALPAPRPAPEPAPRAPVSDPIGSVLAARPAPTLPTAATTAPKVLETAPAPKAAAGPAAPAIPVPTGSTPYPAADRCLIMKEGIDPLYHYAFNNCSYRVNYAWCVTNSNFRSAECGGPMVARGAGAVAPQSNARSTYPGGLGRLYMFACRAPGLPIVKQVDGKLIHECLGPATTTTATAPKSSPLLKAPSLRPLTP